MELLCIIVELFCTSKMTPLPMSAGSARGASRCCWLCPHFPGHCVGVVGFEMTSETQSRDVPQPEEPDRLMSSLPASVFGAWKERTLEDEGLPHITGICHCSKL